jgi:pimeloyl-ACP methyl ester carboxylesterase
VSVAAVATIDGRGLAYEEIGDPAGFPIFMLHGTPGCRLANRYLEPSKVAAARVRLVTYDRPGYGRSARLRGRSVVDCVEDVAAIADDLGIGRFAVMGSSGGGPHALAVAARLPDRVTRAACLVGLAPFDAAGLDWFAGLDPVNVREAQWALAGEQTLRHNLEPQVREALERVDDDPLALYRKAKLSASDWAVLNEPWALEARRAATPEMYTQGATGWVDDELAFVTQPWGFHVREIRVPVEVRYGTLDVLVPPAHGERLAAHIPHATVTVDKHAGHVRTPDQRLEILRSLAKEA